MTHLFQTLGWPDLVAILIIVVPLIIVIYLPVAKAPFFTLNLKHIEEFRWFFSVFFVMFFVLSWWGASSSYFIARYRGDLPSYNLVLSAVDYSFGDSLILFIVCIPIIYAFYLCWSYMLWLLKGPQRSSLVVLLISAPIIPGTLASVWFFNNPWLANVLFGIPESFEQLVSHIRFTELVGQLISNLSKNKAYVELIAAVLTILAMILGRSKVQEKDSNSEIGNQLPTLRNNFSDDQDIVELDEFPQSLQDDVEEQELPYILTEKNALHPVDETLDAPPTFRAEEDEK